MQLLWQKRHPRIGNAARIGPGPSHDITLRISKKHIDALVICSFKNLLLHAFPMSMLFVSNVDWCWFLGFTAAADLLMCPFGLLPFHSIDATTLPWILTEAPAVCNNKTCVCGLDLHEQGLLSSWCDWMGCSTRQVFQFKYSVRCQQQSSRCCPCWPPPAGACCGPFSRPHPLSDWCATAATAACRWWWPLEPAAAAAATTAGAHAGGSASRRAGR